MKIYKKICSFLLAALIMISSAWSPPAVHAEHHKPSVNYGAYCRDSGGSVHKRLSIGEAIKAMRKYFWRKGLEVKNITHDHRFVRADLVDKSGEVVDSVVLDSLTGRLRSIN